MIVCPNCGRENADNFNFCLDCGYDLKTYRESQGDGSGPVAPPPVGPANTPAPEPLGHGASTESLNADEVRELAQSASNPSQPAVADTPPVGAAGLAAPVVAVASETAVPEGEEAETLVTVFHDLAPLGHLTRRSQASLHVLPRQQAWDSEEHALEVEHQDVGALGELDELQDLAVGELLVAFDEHAMHGELGGATGSSDGPHEHGRERHEREHERGRL